MKQAGKRIFFSLLLILISLPIYSQNSSDYLFDSKLITTEDGLSNLFTSVVFKDSLGYIWIANQYGLDRYDGYEFKHYNSKDNGLDSRTVMASEIQEDDQNNKWLFIIKKLKFGNKHYPLDAISIFDPVLEKAVSFETFFKKQAIDIKISDLNLLKVDDPKRRVWFSTLAGEIYRYQNKKLKKLFHKEGELFYNLVIDSEDNIWVNSGKKVFNLDQKGTLIDIVQFENEVVGLWAGEEDKMAFATASKGWKFDENPVVQTWIKQYNQAVLPFHLKKGKETINPDTFGIQPFALQRTANGLWYSMVSGQLNLFDPMGNWLYEFPNFSKKESGYGISEIECNADGSEFWACSAFGLLKINLKNNHFNIVHQIEDYSDSREIIEADNGMVYFVNKCTYQLNPSNGQIDTINTLWGLAIHHQDSLLLTGLYTGHHYYSYKNLETGESNLISKSTSKEITDFLELEKSNLLLTATTKGLDYINLTDHSIKPFLHYNEFQSLKETKINHLHRNSSGIWIASANGLYLLDEEKGIVNHYNVENSNLRFDYLLHIYEDTEGIFWMATKGGGFLKWKPESTEKSDCRQYTVKDGLSNNFTYAVYGDEHDKLWIPSDKGLNCMDKTNEQIKTYLTEDGLPHNEFNFKSHLKAKDGRLYFGGLGGVISFDPSDFAVETKNETKLSLNQFKLFDGEIENLTDKTKEILKDGSIYLQPTNLFFEMEFAYMDFTDHAKHKFAYMIEGFHKNWNPMKSNSLRINNLPYGDYTLKIKAGDSENGWSSKQLSYPIHVLKPFYLRWWFILSLMAFAALSTLMLVRWRIRKLQEDKETLESEVKKRTIELEEDRKTIKQQAEDLMELDKVKTRFFSNITHEFRTPLTLIIGPLEQLVEKTDSNFTKTKVNGALKNANHLLDLLSQLLDLSKLEDGKMPINYSHGDIVVFTKDLLQRFTPLVEAKHIRISFTSALEHWDIDFDKSKWTKIVLNLLSNAIKFTPHEGEIQLELNLIQQTDQEFIRLLVKDTGQGISEENIENIFKRFYQIDGSTTRRQEGTGIGLALVKELVELQKGSVAVKSTLGKGTSFEIILPVSTDAIGDSTLSVPTLNINPAVKISNTSKDRVDVKQIKFEDDGKLELLIVEDNQEIREYICSCLDDKKYNFYHAVNGKEGLDIANEIIPDLIISDVMMPIMDGFELTTAIRSNITTSHIPIILLTAKTALDSRIEGLEKGADAYLNKPFSHKELDVRIRKLLELRNMIQLFYQQLEFKKPAKDIETKVSQKEKDFMEKVKSSVLANIDDQEYNVTALSKEIGMSRMQLHRKLKALTNRSAGEIIKSTRLEKAYELLKKGDKNVSEVAYETGFASPGYFSTSFKKRYNISPSEIFENKN